MHTSRFTEYLDLEVATLQATFPDLAEALGRGRAILTDGLLFPEDDGRTAMVRSSDGDRWYFVNGHCDCKASAYRSEPCKHRLSLRLYHKVAERLMADEERYTLDLDPAVLAAAPPVVSADYIVQIQGRPFVKFEGLLAIAHERGLLELTTTVVQCSVDLAVCQAVARFQDGRVFTDIGDATPSNVAKHLAPHFIRMAATRASARALRRALRISACSVEELGQEVAA